LFLFDEREDYRLISIAFSPVRGQLFGTQTQDFGSQIFGFCPWKNEKPNIVADAMAITRAARSRYIGCRSGFMTEILIREGL